MPKLRSLLFAFLVLSLGSSTALAQRRLSGRVTAAENNEPLAGASVTIPGSTVGTYTSDDGRFFLNAPDGDVSLLVRRLGYKRKTVAVAAGQTEVNITLDKDVFQLEEQIVTGTATTVSRQNAANDIATVNADELNRAPTPTLENAMQGKVAGATIQANSGAPGGGIQVQLRGVSSINAAADPLYVIDGVIISNAAIDPNINAVTAAAAGGNANLQGNPVNRIADLNPADIERIEILKGASASAIYGAKASNGVIIITTKKGLSGKPQYNITQRIGTFSLAHEIGSRHWTLADALASFASTAADTAFITGQVNDGRTDLEKALFGEHPFSYETDISARGGNDQTSYFASALMKRDGGIMKNTGYNKQSLRLNLSQAIGSKLKLDVNSNLVHSLTSRGLSNNDNSGTSPYIVLALTPDFFDLLPKNGVYPVNPILGTNPFQTRDLSQTDETVYRLIGGGSLSYNAYTSDLQSVQFRLSGGVDEFSQKDQLLFPPELYFEPADGLPGTSVLGNNSSVNGNVDLSAVHTFTPTSKGFTATTSFGVQREKNSLLLNSIIARNLFAGQGDVTQGSNLSLTEQQQKTAAFALYGQEEFLALSERMLLTVGARGERNTNNGDVNKLYWFPKASASYRFTDALPHLDEFKLRVAVGQSGNQPLYGMKFNTFQTAVIGGGLALFENSVVNGDPTIKPELQTEVEGGFDATLFNERANINVTLYQKNIADLILLRTLAPSTGTTSELFNGGKLRDRGVEIGAGVTLFQSTDLSWLEHITFSKNNSLITSLPVPAFQVGGFGTALGAFQIEQGKSATQIVGNDANGNVVVVGDAAPDFQMSFLQDITFHQWHLSGLIDWKKGGDIINLTKLLYDIGQNTKDYGDTNSPGYKRIANLGTNTNQFVENGGYVKLRELTLGHDLPQSWTDQLFRGSVRSARMELSGRNLWTHTKYTGPDPEVSNFANQQIARNIDVAPYPPSRSFWFSLSVDF